ncbi:Subtilase-type proteinase RRT12 [Candida viswanathii]|uniref:Subtilase-type proteinase RRT12 n=1 Tax=Candida viswanathii TaxID=5486 RepID=A0A367YK19_9ASCO|nr:Subtilase-type proteinase RRT12 [Candida viswanathii]
MRLTIHLATLLVVAPILAYEPYLISLHPKESLDTFMSYDSTYPEHLQVKELIKSSFHIGNFSGFAGNFSEPILARLSKCPLVEEIVPDVMVHAYDISTQYNAPRHLARISRRKRMLPLIKYPFVYDADFVGKRVNAYVIDSGVDIGHPEFQGRARSGTDFTNEGIGDQNGHGTHVAGLIGSQTYGVAKDVSIIDVKALNAKGTGALSTILLAIEYAVNHRLRSGRLGVANLSLGAYKNNLLNRAIEQATLTGLVFVVAAGNNNINACLTSPSSSPYAVTVGAIDDFNDSVASFSNWGPCVDVFASGSYVKSVNIKSHLKPLTLLGTSMAAPIVTGIAASLLSEGIDPEMIKDHIIEISTKGMIPRTSLFLRKKTPNRIANNGVCTGYKMAKDGYFYYADFDECESD